MNDNTDCKHEFVYPSTGLCRECGERISKRKSPGRPALAPEPMVLIQGFHAAPADAEWFASLPGKSKRERLAWLRTQIEDAEKYDYRNPADNPWLQSDQHA